MKKVVNGNQGIGSLLHTVLMCTFLLVLFIQWSAAVETSSYITGQKCKNGLTLAKKGKTIPWLVSTDDYPGIHRIMTCIQKDIERATGASPDIVNNSLPKSKEIVVAGTLGKNPWIDELVEKGKIQVDDIRGKWECSLIQVVEEPFKDVRRALVIVGSDKRGTIYGMFDLSSKIGVSPWTWWADVPVKQQSELYVLPGRTVYGEPAVKYRGIFLNDEEPALGRWAVENYGGFNSQFYEKVFELLLRLKGNFLWPAMWWAAFNANDPENPRLADEMGIVMGTSHHEPMSRAHAEWRPYGGGAWNYETNEEQLRQFWQEGIERMNGYETIVTLAMRGDGDMAMSPTANIALLEKIVADQRRILTEVTGKDLTDIPQVWALYKEVQEYYDKGMRVPEDVTLLLCDDNWGNVRILPELDNPPRSGGYGMYYHFDFVGGPRNYKWLNVNPIARIWEQMHLSYRHGVDRIWIVNVGDLKPMEFPISFFLDYAWNPDVWPAERLPEYTKRWAEQQFGPKHAEQIAFILTEYARFNSRRTPEMLSPDTYSLVHFREADRVVHDYRALLEKAEAIAADLPEAYQDAYYQLVLHPVQACSNLNELYVTVAKNRLYASQGRASANDMAEKAGNLFKKDAEITNYYNHIMADGKWNHMMDQTHIGYTYWQQPDSNSMPEVTYIEIPAEAEMGVAIEGSASWWPMDTTEAVLPAFDPWHMQTYYVDVFNRGQDAFTYSIDCKADWIMISPEKSDVKKEKRLTVAVNWEKAPSGRQKAPFFITGPGNNQIEVKVAINNPKPYVRNAGFIECNHYVAMEAEHFTGKTETEERQWLKIPGMGRTLSGMTPVPVTFKRKLPEADDPRLEYRMLLFNTGTVRIKAYLSPTQNFLKTAEGLRYGISVNDESPQIIYMHEMDTIPDWKYPISWNEAVGQSIKIMTSEHTIDEPGEHILKYWMVDPGVVLQKIVVETGPVPPTYLGPPESYRCFAKDKK